MLVNPNWRENAWCMCQILGSHPIIAAGLAVHLFVHACQSGLPLHGLSRNRCSCETVSQPEWVDWGHSISQGPSSQPFYDEALGNCIYCNTSLCLDCIRCASAYGKSVFVGHFFHERDGRSGSTAGACGRTRIHCCPGIGFR